MVDVGAGKQSHPFANLQVYAAFDKQGSCLVIPRLQDNRSSAGDSATVDCFLNGLCAEYGTVCYCAKGIGGYNHLVSGKLAAAYAVCPR